MLMYISKESRVEALLTSESRRKIVKIFCSGCLFLRSSGVCYNLFFPKQILAKRLGCSLRTVGKQCFLIVNSYSPPAIHRSGGG